MMDVALPSLHDLSDLAPQGAPQAATSRRAASPIPPWACGALERATPNGMCHGQTTRPVPVPRYMPCQWSKGEPT